MKVVLQCIFVVLPFTRMSSVNLINFSIELFLVIIRQMKSLGLLYIQHTLHTFIFFNTVENAKILKFTFLKLLETAS